LIEVHELVDAALGLTGRAAAAEWQGADPYDGLSWHWPHLLVAGRRRRQAIVQLHARSPIDIRRLYRPSGARVPKALAVFGSAGLRIHALTGDTRARELAIDALELLHADRQAGPVAWGYPWDVQTRWSFYPAGSPNIVNIAFAVGALLEAERELERTDLGDRARAAASWVLDALWVEEGGFFAYHPHSRANIHNANLLGAWLAWAALGHQAEVRYRVLRAVGRTIADQRHDGSWPYGEGSGNLGWADSFHSGYVLVCLDRLRELDPGIGDAVARGARFYSRFFGPAGEAWLWADRRYPEDGHSAGTGLTTLAVLVRRGLVDHELLERVARRLLDFGIRNGHAVCRRYRWGARTTVRYVRWCDAHVALGLVDAAVAMAAREDPAPSPSCVLGRLCPHYAPMQRPKARAMPVNLWHRQQSADCTDRLQTALSTMAEVH
jgi:hypothetical protein